MWGVQSKHLFIVRLRYLLFPSDLSWYAHINKIANKANTTQNLQNCPKKCKQTDYVSLVLLCGTHICKKTLTNLREALQRKALRFIYSNSNSNLNSISLIVIIRRFVKRHTQLFRCLMALYNGTSNTYIHNHSS